MKLRAIYLLIVLAASGALCQLHAQKIISYGLRINPGITLVSARNDMNFEGFSKRGGFGPNFGATFHYYLNKRNAIMSGLHLQTYAYSFNATGYNINFDSRDSENQPYTRMVTGTGISENSKLTALILPVCIQHEIPLSREFRLFVSVGPSLAVPVHSRSAVKGVFSYKGYYADGNYTLENIPVYGFSNDVEVDRTEKLSTSLVSVQATAAVGCIFHLNRYWRLSFDINYSRPVTSLLEGRSSNYYVSDRTGSFHALLGSPTVSLNNFSAGLSIRKNILF